MKTIERHARLAYHLEYNHYPPVPSFMVPFADRAIELAQDGDLDANIETDINGRTALLRLGDEPAIVRDVMDNWHLWSFVEEDDVERECWAEEASMNTEEA